MSHKILYNQIVTVLRADTGAGSLVTLTKHSARNSRILREVPPAARLTPFLGVKIFQSVPLIPVAPRLQVARVYFSGYSTDEGIVVQILDRLQVLLITDGIVALGERYYLDFTGGGVKNLSTLFKSRSSTRFDEDTEIWESLIQADVFWLDGTCS